MEFGTTTKCHICGEEIVGDYHRYTCDIVGIDMEFYACHGECALKFSGEYVEPFEPVESRWHILDL